MSSNSVPYAFVLDKNGIVVQGYYVSVNSNFVRAFVSGDKTSNKWAMITSNVAVDSSTNILLNVTTNSSAPTESYVLNTTNGFTRQVIVAVINNLTYSSNVFVRSNRNLDATCIGFYNNILLIGYQQPLT